MARALPRLVGFSGLPGTGKTTESKALAARLHGVYIRIDAIDQPMKDAAATPPGHAAYVVAHAIAEANLRLGHCVIADCVNPVAESRQGWRRVATQASARLVDILLHCSDPTEHRRRLEQRVSDIPGQIPVTWDEVTQRPFEPNDDDHLALDSATHGPAELVDRCEAWVMGR